MQPADISRTRGLAVEEVERFRADGYLVVDRPIFAPERFRALVTHFEGLLAAQVAEGFRPETMDKPHYADPKLFDWVLGDEILDLVESLLGPDFHLFVTHFICKPGKDGKRVPWHEDSAYWRGILDPMEAVTVWLAIDPSTESNGCMQVVPGSHRSGRRGYSDYEPVDVRSSVFPTEIISPQRRHEQAVPVVLAPNQCSIHDARMIHGSAPNTSGLRRCGFTMRFVPAHVRLSPKWESQLRLYPARGRDLAGNRLADPSQAYPELAAASRSGRAVH